jgi:hypothetical protein
MTKKKVGEARSYVAPQKGRFALLAFALVALIAGAFLAGPRAFAADAIDADSARWAAIGESYASIERGLDASSARWAAVGRLYDAKIARGLEADTARWVAKDQSFRGLAARSTDADTARWVAKGRFYSDMLARGRDADSARWAAAGRFYSSGGGESELASSPELMLSRAYARDHAEGLLACSLEGRNTVLSANPELAYLGLSQEC